MLIDNIAKNAAALRQAGPDAIQRAKRLGVAAYYRDQLGGPGFIKEHPDGRRERVDLKDSKEVVIGSAAR